MYEELFSSLESMGLQSWSDALQKSALQRLDPSTNADLDRWLTAVNQIPDIAPEKVDLNDDAVRAKGALADTARTTIRDALKCLHPWRKGPFDFFGIHVDSEWRSDLKWNRVSPHIDLHGKAILDVGSGNGYYGFRMLGAGAKMVCGLDPFLLYVVQYRAVIKLLERLPNYVVPVGDEVLSQELNAFDTVFSMGVLYHRRSPLDHLIDLRKALRSGGQLVLETLVVDDGTEVLVPRDRYAKMRNVWMIPSVALLGSWLERVGFQEIHVVDITKTTSVEQRRTAWMEYESLEDFLDPFNPKLTIEGYPAPVRAIAIAHAK